MPFSSLKERGRGNAALSELYIFLPGKFHSSCGFRYVVTAVLVTQIASKKIEKAYVQGIYYPPPYYGTWPAYYGYGYNALYVSGCMTEEEAIVIETNLHDAATNKLILASSTDIAQRGAANERMFIYIDIVMKSLGKDGLLC